MSSSLRPFKTTVIVLFFIFAVSIVNCDRKIKTQKAKTPQVGVESSHDAAGIIWPKSVAPFDLCIVNLAVGNELCDEMSLSAYNFFKGQNKEILYDDTKESIGSKLAKMDLVGIPFQIIIGPRLAKDNKYEFKNRSNGEKHIVDFDNLINLVNS